MKKNKFVEVFERFGRSFLLPVSVLPGAGIIMGIGTAFSNANTLEMFPFLNIAALQFVMKFLIALGSAAFDNLPIIFAVGVAVGLAKKERGSAALSGLLGFLVLHIIINFLLKETGMLTSTAGLSSTESKLAMAATMQTRVLGIQTMDLSVFGGIITGVVVYNVHKWAVEVQLPAVVGFFSGPRFVPIATMFVMALVACGLFLVWPFIQKGITFVSMIILKSGYFGTFLYGVVERALLPFGLHHGLNWPVRTTELGGTWNICGENVSGTINGYIASLNCPDVTKIDPSITRFNSGKVAYFMFGIPGAALAMYHTAKPEKKKEVGSLLFAAAGTAFLTGITEPIEFTFLFVAPMLYAVHALLVGFSFLFLNVIGAAVSMPTGHGFINFVIYGVLQGPKTSWWLIPLSGLVLFPLCYFVFKFMILKFDFKTPGREDIGEAIHFSSKDEVREKLGVKVERNTNKGDDAKDLTTEEQALALIDAHGGPDNIEEVDACITRLRINVKNRELVDENLIKTELAAMGFAESGMQMQSIYGAHANVLKMKIRELLGMEE